ncbi:MAG: hypothetical protein ACI9JR_000411 [Gammaproteobacteria bacterium]|jgi:hypothetical protein
MALEIIGAGLGRTGTASVKVALETLGVGRCYHMTEVMQNPDCMQDWMEAANGNPDWDKIFRDYGATVDYPGCSYWQELASHYPEAKILLTVRDANSWFESTHETIMAPKFSAFIKNSPWGNMAQKTIWDTLDNRMGDRDFMVPYFEKRNKEIIDAFPADRLLVYQVNEGWEPLCKFLGVPVPDTDFPRINSRDETKELFEEMIADSGEELSEDAMAAGAQKLHGKKPD